VVPAFSLRPSRQEDVTGASERAVVRGLRVTASSAEIATAHDGAAARSDGETFETGMPTSISGIHNDEH
jgi:hypothetical protein